MKKQIIAVDIDEVLFPFIAQFAEFHNARYKTKLTPEQFLSYEFEHALGLNLTETIERVYEFTSQDHLHIQPLGEAQTALKKLSEEFELHIITARNPKFEASTRAWIETYFEGIFSSIELIGYAPVMEKPRTKAEVCLSLGAQILIDDSVDHLKECSRLGIEGVLFGDYTWNQTESLPKGVVKCTNWEEVLEHFDGRS